jgi:two-component system chemotaxis response regulator CheB
MHPPSKEEEAMPGTLAAFVCPECSGNLWELRDGDLIKFRCRVGHSYSEESFIQGQSEALEQALWIALRALEESASAARKLAKEAISRNSSLAETYERRAAEKEQHAGIIRRILANEAGPEPTPAQDARTSQPELEPR